MGEQVHQCVVGPSDAVRDGGQEDVVPTGQNIVLESNKSNGVDEKVIAGLDDVEGFARCVNCQPCGIGALRGPFEETNELFGMLQGI